MKSNSFWKKLSVSAKQKGGQPCGKTTCHALSVGERSLSHRSAESRAPPRDKKARGTLEGRYPAW